MAGMKNRTPGRAQRRTKPATPNRLNHAAQTLKAAARVMRELTRLIWWSAVPLATIGLAVHALLTGSAAELIEFLIALQSR